LFRSGAQRGYSVVHKKNALGEAWTKESKWFDRGLIVKGEKRRGKGARNERLGTTLKSE